MITEPPEAFGLVRDIIRVRRPIDRLTPAETEERSHTGIIASNYLPMLPDGLNMVRFTTQDVRDAENNLGLLMHRFVQLNLMTSVVAQKLTWCEHCGKISTYMLQYDLSVTTKNTFPQIGFLVVDLLQDLAALS